MLKLNTLLAKTDHLGTSFKALISDYIKFFKEKQGAFLGERKTYTAKEGTIDEPSMRAFKAVTTTVDEKLNYMTSTSNDFISSLLSVEATNASGKVRTTLIVDGVILGELSSLELLRLKSLLEDLKPMYESIPVRSDAEEWEHSTEEAYTNRAVFQTKRIEGVKKSTTKESYILTDPNVANLKDTAKYTPVVASKDTIIELGEYTHQRFSGEFTPTQRATILQRRHKLLAAVVVALKECNDAETIQSELTADKLFTYLHTGTGSTLVSQ